MVYRYLKKHQWEHVYRQITTHGRAIPTSFQYDVDVDCNGVDYILRMQPENERRLLILHAIELHPDSEEADDTRHSLIDDNAMLYALLEIIIYQSSN